MKRANQKFGSALNDLPVTPEGTNAGSLAERSGPLLENVRLKQKGMDSEVNLRMQLFRRSGWLLDRLEERP
jgi:hypothetical protein